MRTAILLSLLLVASASQAQTTNVGVPTVQLRYAAAGGCPPHDVFVGLVEARIGRDPFDDEAATAIEVTMAREGTWQGTVRWIGPSGEILGRRQLEAPRCADLAESLAVVVGLLLEAPLGDPELTGDDRGALPATPVDDNVASLSRPEDVPPASLTSSPEEIRIELGGSVEVGVAWTPDVSLGASLFGGVRWGFLSVLAHASIQAQPVTASLGSSQRVDAFSAMVGLGVCLRPPFTRLCVEGGGGMFQATVYNVEVPTARTSATAYVTVHAGARVPLSDSLELEPWLSVSLLPLRPALEVGRLTVWTGSVVTGRVGVSIVGALE